MSRDRTWLVALAACLWGSSALLREPLAGAVDASTIVLYEHLVILLALTPWLLPALRTWAAAPPRVRVSAMVIGAGSSALATTLFTAAFAFGDPITPQVLQKLQPLVALVLAAALLGERLRPRFALFAVPALAGAWLLSFEDPLAVTVSDLTPAALALGAATLWAAGTVLGRLVGSEIGPRDTLVLRFAFGLPAAAAIVSVLGAQWTMPVEQAPSLVALALIPGLLALGLYYLGLERTAASRATLAELMFPVTAAIVGVTLLDATLTPSRWLGLTVVVVSITALALHENRTHTPSVRVAPANVGSRAKVSS
ncbi:MAG TPA: EamA family transporter [Ornithinimicrobium sp.]|uniref:DMT family transporter n=1 Tax=Ornithinimicrobium sp. TaxID=1977084 RepID=UPI002B485D89|nr:EamA family transporter [Ornithinimicrobium sp.]HKJ10930.1 EamA family transporter [Ornithinimicrobium sp.]